RDVVVFGRYTFRWILARDMSFPAERQSVNERDDYMDCLLYKAKYSVAMLAKETGSY
ncbi:hypothetical protein LSH36_748g00028, partial [Paralvinella palmiformis]